MSNENNPLSPEDAMKLLDLLCTDDAFRKAFATDPAAALRQISPQAGDSAYGCPSVEALAGKEEFQRIRDQLLDQLAAVPPFRIPHCFISGHAGNSMLRKPTP